MYYSVKEKSNADEPDENGGSIFMVVTLDGRELGRLDLNSWSRTFAVNTFREKPVPGEHTLGIRLVVERESGSNPKAFAVYRDNQDRLPPERNYPQGSEQEKQSSFAKTVIYQLPRHGRLPSETDQENG